MDISIQPNEYLIRDVSVKANPQMPDLLTLTIDQGASGVRLVLPATVWQRVADALVAAGIHGRGISQADPVASLAEVPDFLKELES